MGKKNKYLILLILGTAFWGISFPATKMSVANNAPSVFLFYRFLFAAVVISIIFYKQLKNAKTHSIIAGIGLAIPLTFGIYFQTLGILKHPSASQCAFVAGMCVMIIPVLKTIFYSTAIEPKIWLSATLALVGLAIISITAQFSVNIGDVYVLTGTIGFSYYMIQVENFTFLRIVFNICKIPEYLNIRSKV